MLASSCGPGHSDQSFEISSETILLRFPGGSDGKRICLQCGRPGVQSLGSGRSPGEGHGNPLQYSCLENSMDCIVHRVAKSQIWLSLSQVGFAWRLVYIRYQINIILFLYLLFSPMHIKIERSLRKFLLTECISSVQFSHSVVSDSLRPHESQHARPPCLSPTPGVHSDSQPSSQWCHPAISSSVVPFSSCPQSLPASESFPMSQLFAWGGQSIRVSASASVLPKNTQGWSPSECTGWISLQSKGLSRVFSNTTVQKHQFFGAQLSSESNSHIHTWPLEKTIALTRWT